MFSVYCLQNKINNKLYIGKSSDPERRFIEHKSIANGSKPHEFSIIHAAIKKYGKDNFSFQILESWDLEQDSYDAEEFWIEFFRTNVSKFGKEAGYNVNSGGKGFRSGKENPMFGKILSDKDRLIMSIRNTGEGNPNFGKHSSIETKLIMSDKKKNVYFGENNPRAKLTNIQASEIRVKFNSENLSIKDLSIEYNVKESIIRRILKNETYKG